MRARRTYREATLRRSFVITLVHDPIGLGEVAVIVACLVFYGWWFSPRQRRKRRRDQARDRAQLRRAFTDSTKTTRADASMSSPHHNQKANL